MLCLTRLVVSHRSLGLAGASFRSAHHMFCDWKASLEPSTDRDSHIQLAQLLGRSCSARGFKTQDSRVLFTQPAQTHCGHAFVRGPQTADKVILTIDETGMNLLEESECL